MAKSKKTSFPKTPTGINGLDEITNGGFPTNEPDKGDQRVRSLLIVKSRGMGHHNSKQEFIITHKGLQFFKQKT